MSQLKERIRGDLTGAMKARDAVRTRTLRSILTAISNAEVAGSAVRELTDDEIVTVIGREAKKRREAADAFDGGGRDERAAAERAEGVVLEDYLPKQLGDDELTELVDTAIAEVGATDMKAMGQVMRVLTPRVAGRADGKRVAGQVRARLG